MATPYDRDARRFFEEYEMIPFERAHARFLPLLPEGPGMVLDVGAGSGRDAAWFAARGHEVFAVEPATTLRDLAQEHHAHPRIHWIDDRLPNLDRVQKSGVAFDVVWVSAVWMHVPSGSRVRAFRKLAACLRPGGRLFVSLRHGPFDDDREAWPVEAAELLELARRQGLICVHHGERTADGRGRPGVFWETMVFELPDDGSGAFPRIRNILLNDDRSATYKLGLLRALLRIADGSAGYVERTDAGDARVPLGLVALYWIRLYKPLLAAGFRQAPGVGGYGFRRPSFDALAIPPSMLKPGARFDGAEARRLGSVLGTVARHLVSMPARYITDAHGQPVFPTTLRRVAPTARLQLDAATLGAFGELIVPAPLWEALRRHAVWIEPVIESEWIDTMARYDVRIGQAGTHEAYRRALAWISPERDTQQVRALVERLRTRGRPIHCTWRGTRLRDRFDVDHVIPWVRWPCNDLWNLVPASTGANASKGDHLPAADVLARAEDRFCSWWTDVRFSEEEVALRFEEEVRATLPFVTHPSNAQDVFDGLTLLRASLRREQQIPEWAG